MTQDAVKPTPGPWVYVSSDGSIINPNGINDNKDSWHIAELTSKDGCLAANGYLIAEAGTVYHETGLSPRQLLAQRDELLDAAEIALGHMTGGMDGNWADCDPRDKLRAAISASKTSKEGA